MGCPGHIFRWNYVGKGRKLRTELKLSSLRYFFMESEATGVILRSSEGGTLAHAPVQENNKISATRAAPFPPIRLTGGDMTQSDTGTPLRYWRNDSVAHIRFNRPAVLNAIDVPTARAFFAACRSASEDDEVRVLVISGEGRTFIAGGDLAAIRRHPAETAYELIEAMHGGIALLAEMKAPVLASLHGVVAGGGLGVALACDLAIAAEGTRFKLAYVNIGASADCSTSWALPRLVGMRKAMEIALLGDTFDAAEALRLGLVNRVVPDAKLQEETEKLARRLADGPPLALGRLKRLIRASQNRDLQTQLDAEAECFIACATTRDFVEGISAFFDKRPPRYEGR
jgi:2-(1,2-epoxy-1,2-dihydrophenyl)acetyl-CoA isomerase